MINSIKFYYEVVLEMPNRFYSIERPGKEDKLPIVISKEEIAALINAANNLKHRYTLLSKNLLPDLRKYYQIYQPVEYLIEE